ncbi:MAG TPA: isoleucine--tRNA ligase [Polyangiaceae bacterium]|nr:isoleucine--tRNA ligase [Polyangiaceae bacterium]
MAERSPFEKLPADPSLPEMERGVLDLWERLDAFQESNRRREGGKEFVFYDGPPFATGTPHYGHLLVGTIKDIVLRYWSMRGYWIERRFGWDCHGLPIENLAQDALGLNGAPDIRARGVAEFNEQCRSMVLRYVGEWRTIVTRMGRWVDFDNDYKTMDPTFMESVWWVFKQLWDKGRIYRAHRIVPYSYKLSTPLSNLEASANYKDVQDPAITVRFRVRDAEAKFGAGKPVFILAWTTTPWTLPGNLALCVGPDIEYRLIEDAAAGARFVVAAERLGAYYKKESDYTTLATFRGSELAGLRYEPLFQYFADHARSFRVLADAFVSTGDGTGIVHMAPAYGEDDYRICRREGIELVDPLDAECRFTSAVPEHQGELCKDADKAIIRRLKDDGKLVKHDTIVHSYPFDERTDTPLVYRAIEAWYVKVEDLRDRMTELNESIRWVPEAIGKNRFGNWLKDARDWNISRNRFWGSCIPVWIAEDGSDSICVGSIRELEELSGQKVTDLHKHRIDPIEFTKNGKRYKRTPEVLDCWFESGAMPYGQKHYPFENKARFDATFPADFIAEALDQTRAWFYYLLVLSTALFDKPSFENVVVNGLVLAEDGQKMSKSKKNYPDPGKILEEIGADALRAYLIDSPVVRAEPLRFSERGLREIVRTVVLPYWNALSFFGTYASLDGWDPRTRAARPLAERAELDRFVLSVLESLVRDVNREMEAYRLYNVVPELVDFIDVLTNWYVRLSRRRFWKSQDDADKADAYATLYEVLTTFARVVAPFMPFLSEFVYQRTVRPVDAAAPASVHFTDFPSVRPERIDAALETRMQLVRRVVSLGRRLREEQKLKVRQPLARLTLVTRNADVRAAALATAALLREELNVKAVETSADEAAFCTLSLKPNFANLKGRAGPKLKEIGQGLAGWSFDEVARLEAGEALPLAGEAITLADVLLARKPAPGRAVATEGDVTLVLDTALTPELVEEGLAREFVSVLQQARKTKGLEVSDRVRVVFDSADALVVAAVERNSAAIAEEVLAVELARDAAADTEETINGRPIRYGLEKVDR